ncbi:hypothetical protein [Bacillus glycinifermentans]|uniref:Uncharacterized protein n=1 Tax=Bacillus glycinifermentans TaxID=1664069 RepID=A0A0T6BI61_9BACI|nr:hypothetical protein [Bacillus glycinifermentans]KRT87137.1 hypothetical protein AB447_209225 [Bacillus glycinifermentans]
MTRQNNQVNLSKLTQKVEEIKIIYGKQNPQLDKALSELNDLIKEEHTKLDELKTLGYEIAYRIKAT